MPVTVIVNADDLRALLLREDDDGYVDRLWAKVRVAYTNAAANAESQRRYGKPKDAA